MGLPEPGHLSAPKIFWGLKNSTVKGLRMSELGIFNAIRCRPYQSNNWWLLFHIIVALLVTDCGPLTVIKQYGWFGPNWFAQNTVLLTKSFKTFSLTPFQHDDINQNPIPGFRVFETQVWAKLSEFGNPSTYWHGIFVHMYDFLLLVYGIYVGPVRDFQQMFVDVQQLNATVHCAIGGSITVVVKMIWTRAHTVVCWVCCSAHLVLLCIPCVLISLLCSRPPHIGLQGVPWSWNLGRPFSRPGKSWKIAKVMESHG